MRKEKLVTRTFTLTTVDVMLCNTETAELSHIYPEYVGELTDEKALKIAHAEIDDEVIKVVTAKVENVRTELRGMTETQFYDNSVTLPDRKVVSDNE